jgi:hypothetical protein
MKSQKLKMPQSKLPKNKSETQMNVKNEQIKKKELF